MGLSSWKRNSSPLVLKGFVGGIVWMGVGDVLWICAEVILGGDCNSTGNPIGSARLDFWKEGEGKSSKSTLSGKPAVPMSPP